MRTRMKIIVTGATGGYGRHSGRSLLPKLPQDAHIVNMVSLSCRFVSIDDTSLRPTEKDFRQLGTYARAKRAMVSFSQELARRNPLLYVNMADTLFKPLCKSPAAGVQPALRALREEKRNCYYVGKQCNPIPARYINPSLDERIWEETQKIIKPSSI